MGRPDKAFGDFGVPLVVHLKPAVVHQPGPRPFDDPTSRQHLEATGVNLVDDFGRDVMGPTLGDEGLLEAAVTPDLGKASRAFAASVHNFYPTRVVRDASGDDDDGDGDEQSQSVD